MTAPLDIATVTFPLTLSESAVEDGVYKQFDPDRYSFDWGPGYKTVTINPLLWHDDASYARYQGDQDQGD